MKRGLIDRALQPFGDVRPGEGATVLLMCLGVHLLLVAYYVLKTVREPLILLAGGAELKSYAAAAQALALVFYVPFYGWLAARLPRQRFLTAIVLLFVGCIELFVVGGRAGLPHVGFLFYVWVGIFSLTTIAQFWSYANEIYDREQGERLFPLIAIGSAAGAPLGALLAETLFARAVSPFDMMQVAAAILVVHLVLYRVVGRRMGARGEAAPQAPIEGGNGFGLVRRSRYLGLIALLLVLLNVGNTVGEYVLGRSVLAAADAHLAAGATSDRQAFVGAFYGSYFFWTNLATILLQAFVVSRLVKWRGMAGAVLALPVVALGVYATAAAGVGLALLRALKIAENATDYSVNNTAKQMLWLPTSREEKYKAKQAVDTFFVRGGDMLAAGIVLVGTRVLVMDAAGFARTNVAVIVIAFAVAALLLREHRKLTAAAAPPSEQPDARRQSPAA
jgi:ATP:ADP antiporter, AAA family